METLILIIDDEKKISNLLSRILGLEGFKVLDASSCKEGLKLIKNEEIQIVICDVKLPDGNGIELIKQIKVIKPFVEIISLTAFGSIADGVMAIKNGAFNYIMKGDDNEKIIPLVYQAIEQAKLHNKVFNSANKLRVQGFSSIIGESKVVKEAINLARKVAATDTTVLLLGETGTGKEIFAEAIHKESPRKLKSFVALNCSGFSAELLESELFGYKSGAFTGANQDKKGLLEEADGGTLFLDEIGELNLDLQAKLLRVLENQSFIKIGDTRTTRVNVRVLAASNKNLQQEAEQNRFRLDLFYRLAVFSIFLPPLTQRIGDIELLAQYYLKEFSESMNKPLIKMAPGFIELLKTHTWKGNIRELRNIIERVVILAEQDTITIDLLPLEFHSDISEIVSMDMQFIEKQHIKKVLQYTKGNKAETARLLGIGLTTLYRKLEDYTILGY